MAAREHAEASADRDLFDESFLIGAGLLPNPDGFAECMMANGWARPDPLVPHYQRMAEALGEEISRERAETDYTRQQRNAAEHHVASLQGALRWLQEAYSFDELAARVIAFALEPRLS